MNNFLTRLVSRNSMVSRNRQEAISLVKPRIGSRYENWTDLPADAHQGHEINQATSFSGASPRISPDNSAPQAYSPVNTATSNTIENTTATTVPSTATTNTTATEYEPRRQPRQAEGSNPQTAPLSFTPHPIQGDPGTEIRHRHKQLDHPADRTTRELPPIAPASRVMTPASITALAKEGSALPGPDVGVDRNTAGSADREQPSWPDQFPPAPGRGVAASAVSTDSDPSLPDTGRTDFGSRVISRIIQTKIAGPYTDSMAGKTDTHTVVNHSGPDLSDRNQPDRADRRSGAPFPASSVTAAQFSAPEDRPGPAVEPKGPVAEMNRDKPLTSIINTRIDLFDSPETSSHPDGFTASRGSGLPIIHGHDPDRRDIDRAGGNPRPASRPRRPGNEPALPPTIKVSIGRIEVRASTPAPQPPAPVQRPRRGPAVSLNDYLKGKGGRP